jgi:hypothetical protein
MFLIETDKVRSSQRVLFRLTFHFQLHEQKLFHFSSGESPLPAPSATFKRSVAGGSEKISLFASSALSAPRHSKNFSLVIVYYILCTAKNN